MPTPRRTISSTSRRSPSGDLPPVLDLEIAGPSGLPLNRSQLQDWVRAYLGRIYERTGVRGVIYASPAFWVKYLGDTTWFADNGYKVLWIAHWTTATAPDRAGRRLGWERLDVLAVHLERERRGHQRPRRPGPLQRDRLHEGPHPLIPGLGGSIRPLGEVA